MKNSTPSVTEEYTRLEFDILASSLIFIMLAAILGNLVISAVIIRNKKMWTDTNIFVMNLAAGDISVSLFCMPVPLYTTLQGKWSFDYHGTICMLNGFLNSLFFIATIFTHTIISIERYVYIVKPLNRSLTRRRAFYMVIAVWVSSAVISFGPILGWGKYEYNSTTLQCGFGFPETFSEVLFIVLLSFLAFVLPISIMTFNYIRIYMTVRKHSKRMEINAIHAGKEVVALQKQILMTFFIALMAFIILWAPFFSLIAIAVVAGDRSKLPHGLGVAAYWCGFFNSACNPFILGIRSHRFREGIKEIFYSPGYFYRLVVKWFDLSSTAEDTQSKEDKAEVQLVPLQQCGFSSLHNDLDINGKDNPAYGAKGVRSMTLETRASYASIYTGEKSDQLSNTEHVTSRYRVAQIETYL